MIADLKPYAEYKESGSKWLGAVPAKWEVRNLRTLISKRAERDRTDLPLLSVAREKGVFVRSLTDADENHNVIPEDLSNYKVARAGNLVINKMKAWQGSMGIAPCDGIVSPAYFVFDFRIANHAFGQRLLRSKPYVAHFGQASDGVRVGQWDLSIPGMRQIPVLVPPPAEQAAIVRFLDWANGRLERAIRAKRKVIALLTEQKQAIIHRAVTRGLPSTGSGQATPVPLKPSGIPWLGDIPQHWEVISLRMRYSVELGKMLDAKRITGRHSIPYLRNRDVQWDRVLTDDLPVMDIPPSEIARYTVKRGDLLVCEGGQVGRSAFWDERLPVCGFQKALHRVRSLDDSRDYSRFFFYQMQLTAGRGVFSADGNENTFAHLTCEKLRRHRFAFPPFTEQKAVADHLDGELQQFKIATSRLEREIDLLREYRTRLVADVVTGKLDVREAAAQLPDEAAPDTVEEPADVSDETEPFADETAA